MTRKQGRRVHACLTSISNRGIANEGLATENQPFLSDLKFLMAEMEKSFPQINHARRKFGVDIRAQAGKLADRIATSREVLETREFHDLLQECIFTPGVQRAGNRSWYAMPSNVGVLPKDFYLEFFLRSFEESTRSHDRRLQQMLNKPATVKFYTGLETMAGYKEEILRQARLNRPLLSDKTSAGKLPEVVTDIPLAGKVARVSVDMMGPNMLLAPDFYAALEDRLFDFYEHIAGFPHLIFDVRGNPGGYTPFVERMLIGPHLDALVELTGFVFFPSDAAGEQVKCCMDTFYAQQRYPRMDIREMIDKGMLPDLDQDDAKMLGTGAFNHWMTFSPTARRSPFNGQIWVLIDEGTGSASEVFAILARQASVARIVGVQSGGNYSKSRGQGSLFFFDLPSTGMVVTWDPAYFTDARGRHAHEHHVVPDHFNLPGKDALETVLSIIEDGAG
ncbi:MAG: S41 family peptidase [Pseudoxanthomonas sp.]